MSESKIRNEQCACGSGKKFKFCYQKQTENCNTYLIEKHNERESYIINFINKAMDEIAEAFTNKPEMGPRAQLALAFTAVDVLATYWYKYLNLKGTHTKPKIAFKSWINKFCLVKNNNIYSQSKHLQKASASELYELRCAIVHFFGLPRKNPFFLMPNAYSMKKAEALVDKTEEKVGQKLICIQGIYLMELIRSGFGLMCKEFIHNIENNPSLHIDGIRRIEAEVKSRGAEHIELKN